MQYLVTTVKVIYKVMTSLAAFMYLGIAVGTMFVYIPAVMQAEREQAQVQRELKADGGDRLPFSEYIQSHPTNVDTYILEDN